MKFSPFGKSFAALGILLLLLLPSGCLRPPTYVPPEAGPQATIVFTASYLKKGFLGRADGVSSLILYEGYGLCLPAKRELGDIRQVSYDKPTSSVSVPANAPLLMKSFWTGGDHDACIISNYGFEPAPGGTYRITNTQDLEHGTCTLSMQRKDPNTQEYVHDNALRRLDTGCQPR